MSPPPMPACMVSLDCTADAVQRRAEAAADALNGMVRAGLTGPDRLSALTSALVFEVLRSAGGDEAETLAWLEYVAGQLLGVSLATLRGPLATLPAQGRA